MNDAGARVFLRPIGNPIPLGFFALAVGTLVLSGMQLGWIPAGESQNVALVLIGFVFPLQFLAAAFAYLARDGAAAEALGMVAGTWLVVGLVTIASPPGSTSDALGLFLLGVGFLQLAPAAASLTSKRSAAAVLSLTAIRFAVTGVYELSALRAWEHVAGIVGLALFAVAACAGLAMTIGDVRDDPDGQPGIRPRL